MRKRKITLGLIGFAAIASMTLLVLYNTKKSFSVMTEPCTGILISNSAGGAPNTPLYGVTTFSITIPTQILANKIVMNAVDSSGTSRIIGRAQPANPDGTNNYLWNFMWDTSLWPAELSGTAKPFNVMAKVSYNGMTTPCSATSTSSYYIYSSPSMTSTLNLMADPTTYQETAGSDTAKELGVIASIVPGAYSPTGITRPDPNKYGYFEWSTLTSIGLIYPKNSDFLSSTGVMYKPGLIAGSNTVKSTIHYGGTNSSASIAITVVPKPAETTNTNSESGSTSTEKTETPSTTTTNTTATPTATSELSTVTQITSSQIQVGEVSKGCIEDAITAERFESIEAGTTRPTATELTKITSCFATSNYILPSNFSPVDPAKIDSVATDDVSSVSKIENSTKTDSSGTKKQTLKFSGKAKPNSIVVIYIYSDPLIVTTTSDSDGNWQYTLENPLQPGKHEVYSVVNKGDGSYKRSDPLEFLIATAAATTANPNGLNLKLAGTPTATASQSNSNLIYYIVGSVIAVLVAIASLFIAIRIHLKHKPKPIIAMGGADNISAVSAPMSSDPTPVSQISQASEQFTIVPTVQEETQAPQSEPLATTDVQQPQENQPQPANQEDEPKSEHKIEIKSEAEQEEQKPDEV